MRIIDLGLQFRPMTEGNIPRYIGLHHSGGVNTVRAYHQQHLDKGWSGLGYNFVVDLDGQIYKGRDPKYVPAGILGHNQDSLHICAIGNFENMIMPEVQRESLKELVFYCKCLFNTIKEVKGHGELMATDCPGKNYPLQLMKDTFNNGLVQSIPKPPPAPITNKVFKLQHALNLMNITDENGNRLAEDGFIGQHTLAALKKVVVRRGDVSPLVGWIQEQLGISVNNVYGNAPYHETFDAIMKFQMDRGLTVDARPGYYTIKALAS
jgi:N-acetylmuramoyl-L-alanine amidase